MDRLVLLQPGSGDVCWCNVHGHMMETYEKATALSVVLRVHIVTEYEKYNDVFILPRNP